MVELSHYSTRSHRREQMNSRNGGVVTVCRNTTVAWIKGTQGNDDEATLLRQISCYVVLTKS